MQCTNSTLTYTKVFKFNYHLRTYQAFVSDLCPNDTAHYQACGESEVFDPMATGLSGDRRELLQTAPVCGVLCYERDQDLYAFQPRSQECPNSRTLELLTIPVMGGRAEPISVYVGKGGICNGVCDEIQLSDGGDTKYLACVDEWNCGGYKYGNVMMD